MMSATLRSSGIHHQSLTEADFWISPTPFANKDCYSPNSCLLVIGLGVLSLPSFSRRFCTHFLLPLWEVNWGNWVQFGTSNKVDDSQGFSVSFSHLVWENKYSVWQCSWLLWHMLLPPTVGGLNPGFDEKLACLQDLLNSFTVLSSFSRSLWEVKTAGQSPVWTRRMAYSLISLRCLSRKIREDAFPGLPSTQNYTFSWCHRALHTTSEPEKHCLDWIEDVRLFEEVVIHAASLEFLAAIPYVQVLWQNVGLVPPSGWHIILAPSSWQWFLWWASFPSHHLMDFSSVCHSPFWLFLELLFCPWPPLHFYLLEWLDLQSMDTSCPSVVYCYEHLLDCDF